MYGPEASPPPETTAARSAFDLVPRSEKTPRAARTTLDIATV